MFSRALALGSDSQFCLKLNTQSCLFPFCRDPKLFSSSTVASARMQNQILSHERNRKVLLS